MVLCAHTFIFIHFYSYFCFSYYRFCTSNAN